MINLICFTSFSSFRSLLIMQPKTSNYTPLLTHSTADRRMSPSRDISSFSFWLCGEEEEKKEKEKHLLHITYVKKKKKNTRVLSRPGAWLFKKKKKTKKLFFFSKNIFVPSTEAVVAPNGRQKINGKEKKKL